MRRVTNDAVFKKANLLFALFKGEKLNTLRVIQRALGTNFLFSFIHSHLLFARNEPTLKMVPEGNEEIIFSFKA